MAPERSPRSARSPAWSRTPSPCRTSSYSRRWASRKKAGSRDRSRRPASGRGARRTSRPRASTCLARCSSTCRSWPERIPMWMLPVTFALTFAVIFGVYWALVVRPEQGARVEVSKRLSVVKAGGKVSGTIVRGAPRVSSIPAVEALLGRTGTVPARIQELLDGADVQMSVGRFLLSSLLLGLSVYVVIVFTLNQMGTGIFFG